MKRPSLKDSSLRAVETAARVRAGEPETAKKPITTAIVIPARTHELLRAVAFRRAGSGKRMSVSALIVELVENQRAELEKEI